MREVVLYIAMSLDGYIADVNGGVDWLCGQDGDRDNLGSYPTFIQTVDTVLMGYTTYHQVRNELFSDQWPYAGMQTYVLTHRTLADRPDIHFTNLPAEALVRHLRRQEGRDIWLCGGADLVRQFVACDSIDRYHITVIPTLLGGGLPLFRAGGPEQKLRLLSANPINGMVDLVYARRTDPIPTGTKCDTGK